MKYRFKRLISLNYGDAFPRNLRRLRLGRKLSISALADIAGVSRNQLLNLEKGTLTGTTMVDPQLSTIYKLALALEVPPVLLLPEVEETEWGGNCSGAMVTPFPPDYVAQKRAVARAYQ